MVSLKVGRSFTRDPSGTETALSSSYSNPSLTSSAPEATAGKGKTVRCVSESTLQQQKKTRNDTSGRSLRSTSSSIMNNKCDSGSIKDGSTSSHTSSSPHRLVALLIPRTHSAASRQTLDANSSRKKKKKSNNNLDTTDVEKNKTLRKGGLSTEIRPSSTRTVKTQLTKNGDSLQSLQYDHFHDEEGNSSHFIQDQNQPLDPIESCEFDARSTTSLSAGYNNNNNNNNNNNDAVSATGSGDDETVIKSTGATGSIEFSLKGEAGGTLEEDSGGGGDNNKSKFSLKNAFSLRQCLFGISSFRDFCGALVNRQKVQIFIVLLIVINSILIGIGTFDFATENPDVARAFDMTDKAFLIVFTIEISLQFIYHGLSMFVDGWLLFDFIIVILSWSMESLQVFRSFRIFRAARLVTRLTALKNLIEALIAVAPSMSAITLLLLLIFYIYAVMCTVLFKDLYVLGYTEVDYFGRLDKTFFTLFEMMTLEWVVLVRQIMEVHSWAWAIFTSFVVITSFILYSLVIAVVCDAVKVQEHHEEIADHVKLQEETKQRIFLLEQRVGDIAQRQFVILENLQNAVREMQLTPLQAQEEESIHFESLQEETEEEVEEATEWVDDEDLTEDYDCVKEQQWEREDETTEWMDDEDDTEDFHDDARLAPLSESNQQHPPSTPVEEEDGVYFSCESSDIEGEQ